ncbi:uncharacterized protein isoform X1 [Leptinotarsa decemlineata]|uniref:uncharacterized protein isoform X1 n=1 Tax=Leptinotarsa decemlineata TaxID=7539 RepID=UPI003D30911C
MDIYPMLIKSDYSVIIRINSSPFTLGRAANCNHMLLSTSISRIHCSFEKHGNYWIFKDTNANGTYLNGMLIQSTKSPPLMNGDIINFGVQNEFIFHLIRGGSIWEQHSGVADHLPSEIDVYRNSYSTVTPYTTTPTYRTNPTFRTDSAYRTEPEYTNNPVPTTSSAYTTAHPYLNVPEYSTGNEDITVQERSVVPAYRTVPEYTTVPASSTDTASIEDSTSSVPTEVAGPSNTPQEYTTKREMSKATTSSETDNGEELQDEMQCAVCSEMFIKATTLNCSHTFCKFCIETWKKNKSACPICRTKITSMNPTLVLDNVIEMVVQNGSEEVKQHRKEILEDRQKCVEQSKHKRGDSSTEESRIEMVSEDSDSGDESDGMNWSGQMAGTNLERLYIPSIYCFYCDIRGHSSSNCPSRDLDDVHYRVLC